MVASLPTAVFIDGIAIYHMQRATNFEIDFTKLMDYFGRSRTLLKTYYYTTIDPDNQGFQKFMNYLNMTGYHVREIETYTYYDNGRQERGNADPAVEMGLDAMSCAARIDQAIIISNRRTVAPIARRLNLHGIRTVLIASESEDVSMSQELKRECDEYVDLSTLQGTVGKVDGERRERK